jgi:hypothetical protein
MRSIKQRNYMVRPRRQHRLVRYADKNQRDGGGPALHPDLSRESKRNRGLPLMDPSQRSGPCLILMNNFVPVED